MFSRGIAQTIVVPGALLVFHACGGDSDESAESELSLESEDSTAVVEGLSYAVADLLPVAENPARGTVTFTFDENFPGADVEAHVEGLTPGPHGFHIHEVGDCSSPDAGSAGGHFAPDGGVHGSPDNAIGERHLGDLGNLEADGDGVAIYTRHDPLLVISASESLVGKAVIVHEGADDFQTQPDGAAGARIACGVIVAGELPPRMVEEDTVADSTTSTP
jgi:Cu-Zn family superoxide dismutase